MIQGSQGIIKLHACMQLDISLSDPHYTEKVAICCGNAVN